jgi:hypothetical protein
MNRKKKGRLAFEHLEKRDLLSKILWNSGDGDWNAPNIWLNIDSSPNIPATFQDGDQVYFKDQSHKITGDTGF